MGADQSLQWIPWEQLTSRSAEITHSEKDWKLSFDSNGSLKVAQKFVSPEAVVTGDLKVKAALNRRSRAFDLAALCKYTVMEHGMSVFLRLSIGTRHQMPCHLVCSR